MYVQYILDSSASSPDLDAITMVLMLGNMKDNIDGLVQDCSNPSVLAMELLQSCTKPYIYQFCLLS